MGVFSDYRVSNAPVADAIGLPKDADEWSCGQWKSYYLQLKTKFGKARALQLFEQDVAGASFFASVNNCKYDCEFVRSFQREGLQAGNIISKLYCTADTVVTATGDVAGAVGNVGKTTNILTSPPILMIGAGIALFYFLNKLQK